MMAVAMAGPMSPAPNASLEISGTFSEVVSAGAFTWVSPWMDRVGV